MNNIMVFGGGSHPQLTHDICKIMSLSPGKTLTTRFSDGETRVIIEDSARGKDVFIIQPTCAPVNDTFMELFIMADAFKRASARTITAVMPYFGYARQDKKVKPREPITARMVCDFLKATGVNRIMAIDIHAEQIQGFFDGPFDHLYAGPIFANALSYVEKTPDDYVIVSPDASGTKRAENLAKHLNCDFAIITKNRPSPNAVTPGKLIGNVKGKKCIILDDMLDTCGTICQAADMLIDAGGVSSMACCTHPVLSGNGAKKIGESQSIEKILVLDTIPISPQKLNQLNNKAEILSCADLIAQSIKLHTRGESVSSLFSEWRV
jgi:ribose-phosphate pyrophosphokinase